MNHAKPVRSVARRRSESKPPSPQQALRGLRQQTSGLAQEIGTAARTTTRELMQEIRQITREVSETVKEEAQRLLDDQRDAAASKVTNVAKITRQAAHGLRAVRLDNVADLADSAGKKAQRFADYV